MAARPFFLAVETYIRREVFVSQHPIPV